MTEPDRVVLITGAASGIGRATAALLAGQGAARLALVDRDAGRLAAAADALGVATLPLAFDVREPAAWAKAEADIADRFGRLDAAVICAGVAGAGPIAELAFEDWREVLSINLDGAFLTLRTALRLIKAGGRGGAVALVSSVAAVKPEPGVAAYGAAKAGVVALARVAAKEGAPDRIRVNALLPGGVETELWRSMDFFRDLVTEHGSERAAFDALAAMATPLGRYASPEETAAQVAFLLSEAAATITGAVLVADGGYSL